MSKCNPMFPDSIGLSKSMGGAVGPGILRFMAHMPPGPAHLVLTHPPLVLSSGNGWFSRCSYIQGWSKASKARLSLTSQWKGEFFSSESPTGSQMPTSTAGDLQPDINLTNDFLPKCLEFSPYETELEGTLESDPSPFQTSPPTHPFPTIGSSSFGGVGTHREQTPPPWAAHSVVTQHKGPERTSLY